jgi:hypothetical protein
MDEGGGKAADVTVNVRAKEKGKKTFVFCM